MQAIRALIVVGLTGSAGVLTERMLSAQSSELPESLVKTGAFIGTSAKAAKSDLKVSYFDWDTIRRTVTIKRRERQVSTAPWVEKVQDVSSSFFVVDARCLVNESHEISHLYVAGVYPDGDACIEEWTFVPELRTGSSGGGYVPIDQRPHPTIEKRELFRGAQFGHISSVEPDPDGRFVLFLTLEAPIVCRVALPAGTPTVELTQAKQPYLTHGRQLVARHHVSAGRQFHVIQDPRWEADLSVPRSTVILHDADNDGGFESSETITWAEWTQRGYDEGDVWTIF